MIIKTVKGSRAIRATALLITLLVVATLVAVPVAKALVGSEGVIGLGEEVSDSVDAETLEEAKFGVTVEDENIDAVIQPAARELIDTEAIAQKKADEEAKIKAEQEAEKKAAEEKAAQERKAAEEKAAAEQAAAERAAREAQQKQEAAPVEGPAPAVAAEPSPQVEKKEEPAPAPIEQPVENNVSYKKGVASVYSYSLIGNKMANGQTLSANSMIVAHKTLPFGTQLEIKYKGRTVVATVADRGPYVSGRVLDLAPATREALGFPYGVATVEYRIL